MYVVVFGVPVSFFSEFARRSAHAHERRKYRGNDYLDACPAAALTAEDGYNDRTPQQQQPAAHPCPCKMKESIRGLHQKSYAPLFYSVNKQQQRRQPRLDSGAVRKVRGHMDWDDHG